MDFQELMMADLAELEPQAPDSLKEIAYHRLEEMLVRLELAPGSVVTEKIWLIRSVLAAPQCVRRSKD